MKNTNAKNEDWLPIVTSLGLTIFSDFWMTRYIQK